jgi:hypothetical protein
MSFKLVQVSEPRGELVFDREKLLEVVARAAEEILQARAHSSGHVRTGTFAESIKARVVDGQVLVGPEGERNQIIAKVFASRGIDLVTLTDAELAQVEAAMRLEMDRQIAAGDARVE